METSFSFTLTQSQVVDVFKRQACKVTNMLSVASIILLVLGIVLAIVHFLVDEANTFILALLFWFVGIIAWVSLSAVRRSAPKNAANYFKYNSVNDVVEYTYLLTDDDFVVSQPTLGNIMHFKYDMISQVNDLGGYVAVMLVTNQFLPIIDNEQTEQLIFTLKSYAKVVK